MDSRTQIFQSHDKQFLWITYISLSKGKDSSRWKGLSTDTLAIETCSGLIFTWGLSSFQKGACSFIKVKHNSSAGGTGGDPPSQNRLLGSKTRRQKHEPSGISTVHSCFHILQPREPTMVPATSLVPTISLMPATSLVPTINLVPATGLVPTTKLPWLRSSFHWAHHPWHSSLKRHSQNTENLSIGEQGHPLCSFPLADKDISQELVECEIFLYFCSFLTFWDVTKLCLRILLYKMDMRIPFQSMDWSELMKLNDILVAGRQRGH